MAIDLAHDPRVLFAASGERLEAAHRALSASDWVLASYLAGLAIECLLQAFALRATARHDARHDLLLWLKRCPKALQNSILGATRVRWTLLVSVWRNDLRYQSRSGFLGYIRRLDRHRGIRGGAEAIMKHHARRLVEAADGVYGVGVALWQR